VMPARCTLTIEPSPGPPKTLHIRVLSKPPSRPFPGPPFIEARPAQGYRPRATRSRPFPGPPFIEASEGAPTASRASNRGPSRGRLHRGVPSPEELLAVARIAALPGAALHRGTQDDVCHIFDLSLSRPFPGPPFIEARTRRPRRARRACIAALPGAALHRGSYNEESALPGVEIAALPGAALHRGYVMHPHHNGVAQDRGPSRGRPSSRRLRRRRPHGQGRPIAALPGAALHRGSIRRSPMPSKLYRGPSRGRPSSRRDGQAAQGVPAAASRPFPGPPFIEAVRRRSSPPRSSTESRPFPGPPFIEAPPRRRRR